MAYLDTEEFGELTTASPGQAFDFDSLNSGLGEDKFKWDGGKAGKKDDTYGILYGTPMSQAQPIIDAYQARQVAAAAGYPSIDAYNAAMAASAALANPPTASAPVAAAVASPVAASPYSYPTAPVDLQPAVIPQAVPMPVDDVSATAEGPAAFALDWQMAGIGAAALLGIAYFLTRKK